MSQETDERLVRMANQIATFFQSQPGETGEGVAAHINRFWDPRMRARLAALSSAGASGLDPLVTAAIPFVRLPAEQR